MNSFLPVARVSLLVCSVILCGFGRAQGAPPPVIGNHHSGDGSEEPIANRPASAVDVILERIDLAGKSAESVGKDVINDDKHQTLKLAVFPTETHSFLAHIKNTGRNANSFQGSLRSLQGADTAWGPKGWSCYATVNGDTNNILKDLQSKDGWTTPQIEPGAETVLRLAMTTEAASDNLGFDGSFRLVAQKDGTSDAVVGDIGVQYIRVVEWSRDGENWKPVTGPVHVPCNQQILLRALGVNPKIGWEEFREFNPRWDYQEPWEKEPTHALGEMVSLATEAEGTINFTATGGNKIDGQVVITPEEN
ncbi:hypothetical protein IAD21_01194 [Abditibacteriota bacterium]|nr:hypothetical protein IAD21_01194 [Abditibacteriota bacterium]